MNYEDRSLTEITEIVVDNRERYSWGSVSNLQRLNPHSSKFIGPALVLGSEILSNGPMNTD